MYYWLYPARYGSCVVVCCWCINSVAKKIKYFIYLISCVHYIYSSLWWKKNTICYTIFGHMFYWDFWCHTTFVSHRTYLWIRHRATFGAGSVYLSENLEFTPPPTPPRFWSRSCWSVLSILCTVLYGCLCVCLFFRHDIVSLLSAY